MVINNGMPVIAPSRNDPRNIQLRERIRASDCAWYYCIFMILRG